MQHINEYRDPAKVKALVKEIEKTVTKPIRLMEVCGGHTMSIQKFGIPSLLPDLVQLISGPGCPVCVTDRKFIDQSIAYARMPNTIITTYGDLIRVPGSTSTLDMEKALGADIRIVYSVLDALNIARENTDKNVIFLGIGFETTTPGSAVGILNAYKDKLQNFFLFSAHKVMPPAMAAIIDEEVKIDGYIGPGHVSTITGESIYYDIPKKYGLGVVISGFEPVDLLHSILMLVRQHENDSPKVENEYSRIVKKEGNTIAQKMVSDIFEARDDYWRGFGVLKDSGLKIRDKYKKYDAEYMFDVEVEPTREDKGCICGEILKGLKSPQDCKLFGKACNPDDPVGACMVSTEGACYAHYRYRI